MSLWLDRIFTSGILFLILFTPFAFGAVHPWAYITMEVSIFALVIVACVKAIVRGKGLGVRGDPLTSHVSRLTALALPLTLFIALCTFQLIPLPPSLLRTISPQTYEAYTNLLPGWPESVPYVELASMEQGARSEGLETGDGGQTTDIGLQSFVSGQRDTAPTQDRLTPDASRLYPETWFPLSLAPSLSRIDLLQFAAFAALFFLVWRYPFEEPFSGFEFGNPNPEFFVLSPEQRFLRSIFLGILVTGLLLAAVGFIQRFTWNGKILWFFVPDSWGQPMPNGVVPRASGPFVNPDHFANYLSLILPIALACALIRTFMVPKAHEYGFKIFCGFTTFLLFTGILLSLSRGAWISTLLGISIFAWLAPSRGAGSRERSVTRRRSSVRSHHAHASWLTPHGFSRAARLAAITVCILLIVSLFIAGSGGREQVDARLGETFGQDLGLAVRMDAWKDSLPMIFDFPVFGVGLAAWPEVFSRYQPGPWSADYFREAHNDYVELLAETGAIGFGLLAWFFIRGGKRLVQGIKRVSSKNLPLIAGILAALGGMAVHELLDFSLQIPANAFLFTVLLALGLRLAGQARSQRSEIGDQWSPVPGLPSSDRYAQSAITPEWREVGDRRSAVPPGSMLHACRSILAGASRLTPYAGAVAAVALIVCALTQEQSVKRPESVAEAKERIFSRPSKASYHMAMLRVVRDKAPLSWQLGEYKAALWIEPTNPYTRDRYASTLVSMGRTDEALREITRSVAESPSMKMHEYLSKDNLPLLSDEEEAAVEEGFKQALAQSYPGAVAGLAEFYAKLDRFADQAVLYEDVAGKESDRVKKTELLMNAGLAYLHAERAMTEVRGPSSEVKTVSSKASGVRGNGSEQRAASTKQGAGSAEQHPAPKTQNPKPEIGSELQAPSSMLHAASRAFRAAIAASPTDPKPYQQLITAIYTVRKDLDGARELVADGIKSGAPALPLYLSLAEASHKVGNQDERDTALDSARAEVAKLIKNGESPHTLYMALADGARRAGDREQESAALLKALDLQPRSPEVLSRLANVYSEKRNYDRATMYLNRVAGISPNSADLYYRIAQTEEARYHFAAAGRAYARALELAPENEGYRSRYEEFKARIDRNRVTGDGGPETVSQR